MPYPCPIFLYEFEELKMTSMQETKAELTLDHFGNDPITRVENALSGLREGNGVVVLDDESRENEADLIYSSDHLTEKQMALMIRECSGIVCVCLRDEDCKRLLLPTPTLRALLLRYPLKLLTAAPPASALKTVSQRSKLLPIPTANQKTFFAPATFIRFAPAPAAC